MTYFFKLFFGLAITRITVGVIAPSHFSISPLYLGLGSPGVYLEKLV
jgi:hypothetical protein